MGETWARIEAKEGDVSLTTVVGGTTLALRHARTAARVGWTGLRFVIDDEHELARLKTEFSRSPAPEGFQLDFAPSDTSRTPDAEVALLGSAIYLRDTLSSINPKQTPEADFLLKDAADAGRAESYLYGQIRKSVELDGVIAYYVMRPLARVFTRILLNTSVSPNQATLSALAFGIGAAICAGIGGATYVALAGILYWFGGVLDCIDGELARMRLQSSKIGEWLDSMVDEFSTVSLIAGIGIGLSRDGYGDHWMMLGFAGAAVAIMTLGPMYADLHRRKLPIDTAQFPWFFGIASASTTDGPDGFFGKAINIIGYFIRRDASITGTALLLILGLRRISLSIMLGAFAVASILLITHCTVMKMRGEDAAEN
ncbi:MAG: CDP-alcohol phosphatidyltransferase family protein [Myxococcales bacterium]|nr:CDP-alcohol phosphatidyltransferase family protein [Myxococcales bacterium]